MLNVAILAINVVLFILLLVRHWQIRRYILELLPPVEPEEFWYEAARKASMSVTPRPPRGPKR